MFAEHLTNLQDAAGAGDRSRIIGLLFDEATKDGFKTFFSRLPHTAQGSSPPRSWKIRGLRNLIEQSHRGSESSAPGAVG